MLTWPDGPPMWANASQPPTRGSRLLKQCEDDMIDIATLSQEERLRLLEQLWDSLSSTPEAIPLTDAQREELDRRLDELDRDGPAGIPADDVLDRLSRPSR